MSRQPCRFHPNSKTCMCDHPGFSTGYTYYPAPPESETPMSTMRPVPDQPRITATASVTITGTTIPRDTLEALLDSVGPHAELQVTTCEAYPQEHGQTTTTITATWTPERDPRPGPTKR